MTPIRVVNLQRPIRIYGARHQQAQSHQKISDYGVIGIRFMCIDIDIDIDTYRDIYTSSKTRGLVRNQAGTFKNAGRGQLISPCETTTRMALDPSRKSLCGVLDPLPFGGLFSIFSR